jgi:hypothetical protein
VTRRYFSHEPAHVIGLDIRQHDSKLRYRVQRSSPGDAALVARWVGHSVAVLLKVYAKTVDGAEQESLDRLWSATRRHVEKPVPGNE